jgi:hypothetical protein
METYSNNGIIPSIGLLDESIETIKLMPVGGYTFDYLKQNFSIENLSILKASLEFAQDDCAATLVEIRRSNLANQAVIVNLLIQLDNDFQRSLNNIDDILNPPNTGGNVVLTAPQIDVKGVNFNTVTVGDALTLPITISNTGDADLVITGYTGFGSGAAYSIIAPFNWPEISSQTPLILKPNESKNLDVIFSPNASVEYTVTVKFVTNPITVGGINTAVIKGSGTPIIDVGVDSILGKKKPNTKRILTLKNVRELKIKSKNNPDINSPYFDQQSTTHSAKIVADIWQCYTPYGTDKQIQKQLLKDIVIGNGVGSFWYEKCDDFLGGLRPSYQYYYDLEEITDITNWNTVIREQYAPFGNQGLNQGSLGVSSFDIEANLTFGRYLNTIKEELDSNDSYWGKYDSNNPNKTLCEPGTVSDRTYITRVVAKEFQSKNNIKIYGGFRENTQTRSSSLTNANTPDLVSSVEGNSIREIDNSFISKNAYGRLNCLQPKTGCYIKDEKPLLSEPPRSIGDEIIKLVTKATLPEKIPDYPCYRGYKATYIRGFNWERRWEVILDCLGVVYPEYEWRTDETLFNQRGTIFDVWEEVEFSGTEIGFSENCIPMERARIQEPYVDMSDNLGCYELQTTKI